MLGLLRLESPKSAVGCRLSVVGFRRVLFGLDSFLVVGLRCMFDLGGFRMTLRFLRLCCSS